MHTAWAWWPLWMAAWWLVPLGFVGLLFAGRSACGRRVWNSAASAADPGSRDRALEILRERFARGELDEDEYLRRRAALDAS